MQSDRIFFGEESVGSPPESAGGRAARSGAVRGGVTLRGWALPLRLGPDGSSTDHRPDPVVDTVRLVLEVVPGERRLEPGFGCRIHSLPSLESHASRQIAAALAEEALARWVPWLGAEGVEVTGVEGGDLDLAVRVRGSWHRLRIRHRCPGAAPRPAGAHGGSDGGSDGGAHGGSRGPRRPVPVEERVP